MKFFHIFTHIRKNEARCAKYCFCSKEKETFLVYLIVVAPTIVMLWMIL